MPVTYRIAADRRTVRTKCTGDVTLQEVIERRAFAIVAFSVLVSVALTAWAYFSIWDTCGPPSKEEDLSLLKTVQKNHDCLLFVVNSGAAYLLTGRINPTCGDRATLPVRRNDDATTNRGLTVFFDIEAQRTVINLHKRPRV